MHSGEGGPGGDGDRRKVEVEKLLPFDQASDNIKMPREGALSFSCEVELKPEFDLPKLDKIPVTRPMVTVGDDDVQVAVDRLLTMRGTFEPVAKGAIKADDLLYAALTFSVDGVVLAEDENFEVAARDLRVKGARLVGCGDAGVGQKRGHDERLR